MKNKKVLKIVAIILFILGIIILLLSLINKTGLKVKLSNLVITDNSLTIDYTNVSNKVIKNKKFMLFFQNDKKELIMSTILEIDNLNINETKTYEYIQDSSFKEIPKYYYLKEYKNNMEIIENINLNTKMGKMLKESAKEVIEKKYTLETFTNTTLTVNDIEKYLNKEISIFHKKEYNCSLDNSYVLVKKINNNYNYETYIECEIFKEE